MANNRAEGGRIVLDRFVRLPTRLSNARTHRLDERLVREIPVVMDTGRILLLVTNDLDALTEEVVELNKARW